MRVLIYRRLSFALRKRKRQYKLRIKQRSNKGKFFFKKFFYKTLLKSRKYLRSFFFFNKKIRQCKITQSVLKNQTRQLDNKGYEYTILNILLRSQFCVFLNDAKILIKSGFVFINGIVLTDWSFILKEGDCLQLRISKSLYRYFHKSKKFLKKKIALFRYNVWKFYKQKYYKGYFVENIKPRKRKTPKYFYVFFLFKLNSPNFLEIDFTTLSLFFLKKPTIFNFSSYYLNKLFSFKLFSLYNFKKIN